MESVQAQSMHITESKPLCSAPPKLENGIEDISKELENELLWGGGDDGDGLSDDALSEDSYRLKVSDDEDMEDKIDASKTVNNGKNQRDKTVSELTLDVVETNGETLQLSKINSPSPINKGGENGEHDFADDDIVEQDFCDKSQYNLSSSPQFDNPDVDDSSDNHVKQTISVKSHEELTENFDSNDHVDPDITEDKEDDEEQIDITDNENIEEAPSELLTEQVQDEISESKSVEENFDLIPDADVELNDIPNDDSLEVVEDEIEDDGAEEAITDPTESIEPTELAEATEPIELTETSEPADTSVAAEPTEDVSEVEVAAGKHSDVTAVDEESLPDKLTESAEVQESVEDLANTEDASPTEQPSVAATSPKSLECCETIPDTDTEPIAQSKASESSEEVGTKRRLCSSDNDGASAKKVLLADKSEEKNKVDDTIEIIDEAEQPAKADASQPILKTLLVDPKKRDSTSEEIIDVDDDNPGESVKSEIAQSTEDSPKTAESPIKTKPDVVKESHLEKENQNSEESRTRRGRRLRGDAQLLQEKEIITRTKREAAQKAELTVRKNIVTLNNDSDTESPDNMVPYTPKGAAPSPVTLKRTLELPGERSDGLKKLKTEMGNQNAQPKMEPIKSESKKTFDSVRKFFLRDSKQKLKKLTQEELEELFIQKIVETLTMREEIGKLREKAKISERNQEATRVKCQQLSKQINDFEMVLSRYDNDRRSNSNAAPIKINRSVGLQVNFLTDHGVQNLRQLQAAKTVPIKTVPKSPINGLPPPQPEEVAARRGIKVRSPRRSEGPVAPVGTPVHHSLQAQPLISTVTPSSIALSKPADTRTTASSGQMIQHHVVVNGMTSSITRTTKVITPNNKSSGSLTIDLTEEENKVSSVPPPLTAILSSNAGPTHMQKIQSRYQRVVPTTTNVSIPQSAIRLVQPASQPTPTALVNNMSGIGGAPKFVVMQPGRQLVIANNANQIRATTGNSRTPISNITYATVPSMTNGTVRVVPTSGTTVQLYKVTHPAPLPEPMNYPHNPSLKLPPPAPSLKISKVAHGIVLSWNMALTEKFADIASYQLYAYQEIAGIAPNSSNWKKVGDVRALPLPMACTLTQFSEGNNYYFAVRAVDTHSRYGQYSLPGNISL